MILGVEAWVGGSWQWLNGSGSLVIPLFFTARGDFSVHSAVKATSSLIAIETSASDTFAVMEALLVANQYQRETAR